MKKYGMRSESPSFPYSSNQIASIYYGENKQGGVRDDFLKQSRRSNGLPTPDFVDSIENMERIASLNNVPEHIQREIGELIDSRVKT